MTSKFKSSTKNQALLNQNTSRTGIVELPLESKRNSLEIPQNNNNHIIPKTSTQKFQALLEKYQGTKQIIVIQDFPDPDALSSAWAYLLIAENYRISCDIVYGGTISHQENIVLVKLTNLPAQRYTPESLGKKDLSQYQGCILIDSQGTNSKLYSVVEKAHVPLLAVIDHHNKQGEIQAEFIDLRPQTRATATILTQYIQEGLLDFDRNNIQHVQCATALMHGLRSDTNCLMQAQEEDFLAAAYLTRFYDSQLLNAVLKSARSRKVMDVIELALRNRFTQNNFSLSGVGYLRYDDRDAIPQAADFLIAEENIHTAIVYGIVQDEERDTEIIVGSLRTTKIAFDPDEFIKEAFGKDRTGKFFGGGRNMAGGFEIPIGFLGGFNDCNNYAKLKWELFDRQIKQKLLRLVNPDSTNTI